jgi:polysaccharide biosynthesis/export protein
MKIIRFVLFVLLANCATSMALQQPLPKELPADFVIGLEDVLTVSVWREPELSVKEVMVRPDGKVSLPLIGDIQASGLTPTKLQDKVTERLKEFVANPTVTVAMLRIASLSVSVVGKVGKPGVYYIGSPITVLELLARIGGFQEDAKRKNIQIIRQDGAQTLHFSFNYNEVSLGKNLKQNISLKSGDVLIVP